MRVVAFSFKTSNATLSLVQTAANIRPWNVVESNHGKLDVRGSNFGVMTGNAVESLAQVTDKHQILECSKKVATIILTSRVLTLMVMTSNAPTETDAAHSNAQSYHQRRGSRGALATCRITLLLRRG
ncbi:hypothetical protein AMTR_s00006p00262280 [Amborella trichopoda]|uniref:Uncharacterized protein n=1 Tax=Amborella trichopoda TaxID=13333 RepID=W1PDY7_AMBTC|nr:hypothetical protein AMTR_s00006p00262280 [Amborella trichopoda]